MLGLLLLAFLVVPVLELYLFVQVADVIGFLPTLVWIVVISVVGAWLVKREGLQALRRANERVARGEVPTDELVNGVLILFGGALLLAPGFLTDVFGVLLVAPPTRALLRGTVKRRFVTAGPVVIRRSWAPGRRGDVWDADSWEDGGPDRPELR